MKVLYRSDAADRSMWSLLRWCLATLNALAVDDFTRRRQAPAVESAFSVCCQVDDSDDSLLRHTVVEAVFLLANLVVSQEPRQVFERLGGAERLLSLATTNPRSGLLQTLQRAGLLDRPFAAPEIAVDTPVGGVVLNTIETSGADDTPRRIRKATLDDYWT